jgi:hypothetical protein
MATLSGLRLGAVLLASHDVFTVIRYLGAVYLIYLGVRAIRGSGLVPGPSGVVPARGGQWGTLTRGFAVQAANPKALVFFLAFLPQFIDFRRAVWPQVLILASARFTTTRRSGCWRRSNVLRQDTGATPRPTPNARTASSSTVNSASTSPGSHGPWMIRPSAAICRFAIGAFTARRFEPTFSEAELPAGPVHNWRRPGVQCVLMPVSTAIQTPFVNCRVAS